MSSCSWTYHRKEARTAARSLSPSNAPNCLTGADAEQPQKMKPAELVIAWTRWHDNRVHSFFKYSYY
jgi:hypothetical protein